MKTATLQTSQRKQKTMQIQKSNFIKATTFLFVLLSYLSLSAASPHSQPSRSIRSFYIFSRENKNLSRKQKTFVQTSRL